MSAASITKPVGRVRIDSATSLWRAAEYGDLGRLKMLLDAGHDINAWCDDPSEKKHKSPLSFAVEGNEPNAVRLLLRRGANPNLQDGDGDRYPLHWASTFGDHDECAELLVQAGASLDARDAHGHTPLEYARGSADGTVHGFARFGSSLLGQPASRDRVVSVLERAAAAAFEAQARAREAQAAGDSAPPANVVGWTPELAKQRLGGSFWKAASKGDVKTLQDCLDRLAQPIDMPRPAAVSRMSALSIAAFHGKLEAAAFLLSRGADPNVAEAQGGFTPLHFCAHSADHHEVARLLLQHGADVLRPKKDGEHAAAYATRLKRVDTAQLLRAAATRLEAAEQLTSALERIPTAWLPPNAATVAMLADAAERAGVDDALVDRGRAAAATLREQEAAAAAAGGGWMQWLGGQGGANVGSGRLGGGGAAADGVQAAHEAAGEQYELREIATAEMVVDLDGDGDDEGGGDGDGAMQNALRETAASAAPQAEAASCEAHEPADGEALVHVQPPTLQEVQEAEQGTEQTAAAEALV